MYDALHDELADIENDLKNLEADAKLLKSKNFSARADALDFIDFHIIDRIRILQNRCDTVKLEILLTRAISVKENLEAVDTILFNHLRTKIRSGLSGQAFEELIAVHLGGNLSNHAQEGYDNLDIFINYLLASGPLPDAGMLPDADMVFYQQTPARIIFELANSIDRSDILFDIGSGLGHVPILVNLLSGAKTVGVEYESKYCIWARDCAIKLNLPNADFLNQHALTTHYPAANVFFLYTPFKGEMLSAMIDVLYQEAAKKQIRIFSYGPCSPIFAQQSWLTCKNGDGQDIYKLYEFFSIVDAHA